MKMQRSLIDKYDTLMDLHYELVTKLANGAVTETQERTEGDGIRARLKADLKETESELADLRAELGPEEFDHLLTVLFE